MASWTLRLILLCLIALAGLLAAEKWRRTSLRYLCKPLASGCFVALGGLRAALAPVLTFDEIAIVVGLALGAIGDVLLMLPGARWFVAGLFSFLAGHVVFVSAFLQRAVLRPVLALPAGVLATAVVLLLGRLWPRLGSKRGAVAAYAATILMMVVSALGVWLSGEPGSGFIAAGAVLFAVSDVAVARERFVEKSFANKLWGLPTYYAAQILIALSIR